MSVYVCLCVCICVCVSGLSQYEGLKGGNYSVLIGVHTYVYRLIACPRTSTQTFARQQFQWAYLNSHSAQIN